MKYKIISEDSEVVEVEDTSTGKVVHRSRGRADCERWINRHQCVNNITLSAEQLALISPGLGHDRGFDPAAWHSCDALDYLYFIAARPAVKIVEVSSKRTAFWKGKTISFNKVKTAFHEVLCEPRRLATDISGGLCALEMVRQGFAPQMLCLPLELSADEKNEVLNAWRHGKAEWYRENAGMPLRGRAETAKQFAIANPS